MKFGFTEVDADMNFVEFILAGLAGVAIVVAPLIIKVLLIRGGF